MLKWCVLAAALGLLSSASPARCADKPELTGTWQLVEVKWATADGASSIFVSSKSFLVIDADTIIRREEGDDGKVKDRKYSYTVDAKKKPAVYEQKSLDGDNKGAVSTGICEVDGDTLKMCSKAKGLPEDFAIKQGKEIKDKYLYVYTRVKK